MSPASPTSRQQDLDRIAQALDAAGAILRRYASMDVTVEFKKEDHPITIADREADTLLREMLSEPGSGWLSEETIDDAVRLEHDRVWIVDPLDGTKEFIQNIPEWSCSIGLCENGVPVAGGICNPMTGETVIGSLETGVMLNGEPVAPRACERLEDAVVLASRSEIKRGQWERFVPLGVQVKPVGSVAYKMALVAAGKADATWTYVPKSEWDVAAGTALVRAAGGTVTRLDGSDPIFNQRKPLYDGLVAFSAATSERLAAALAELDG